MSISVVCKFAAHGMRAEVNMNKQSTVPTHVNAAESSTKPKAPAAQEPIHASKMDGNAPQQDKHAQEQDKQTQAQSEPKAKHDDNVKHDDKEPVADKDHPSAKPHEYRQEHVQHTQEATHAAIKPQHQTEQKKS